MALAAASKCFDRGDDRECTTLAETINNSIERKTNRYVEANSVAPLPFSYSSDGHPMTLVARPTHTIACKRRANMRQCGSLRKLLAQRGFVKGVRADGGCDARFLLCSPRPA